MNTIYFIQIKMWISCFSNMCNPITKHVFRLLFWSMSHRDTVPKINKFPVWCGKNAIWSSEFLLKYKQNWNFISLPLWPLLTGLKKGFDFVFIYFLYLLLLLWQKGRMKGMKEGRGPLFNSLDTILKIE